MRDELTILSYFLTYLNEGIIYVTRDKLSIDIESDSDFDDAIGRLECMSLVRKASDDVYAFNGDIGTLRGIIMDLEKRNRGEIVFKEDELYKDEQGVNISYLMENELYMVITEEVQKHNKRFGEGYSIFDNNSFSMAGAGNNPYEDIDCTLDKKSLVETEAYKNGEKERADYCIKQFMDVKKKVILSFTNRADGIEKNTSDAMRVLIRNNPRLSKQQLLMLIEDIKDYAKIDEEDKIENIMKSLLKEIAQLSEMMLSVMKAF